LWDRSRETHGSNWTTIGPRIADSIYEYATNMKISHLYIVPHKELARIPIHALPLTQTDTLGDKIYVSYLPSATALPNLNGFANTPVDASVAIFAPEPKLRYSQIEAEQVKRILNPKSQDTLLKSEAKAGRFLEQSKGKDIILFSGHGHASRYYHLSSLMFSDDVLFAHEIMSHKKHFTDSSTVILSACETGAQDRRILDQHLGLMSAFHIAGASIVISTLWKVHDICSTMVTTGLVSELSNGHDPITALTKSTRRLKTSSLRDIEEFLEIDIRKLDPKLAKCNPSKKYFEHPLYWSPFIATGRLACDPE